MSLATSEIEMNGSFGIGFAINTRRSGKRSKILDSEPVVYRRSRMSSDKSTFGARVSKTHEVMPTV